MLAWALKNTVNCFGWDTAGITSVAPVLIASCLWLILVCVTVKELSIGFSAGRAFWPRAFLCRVVCRRYLLCLLCHLFFSLLYQ